MSNSNLTSYNFHDSNIRVEQNDKGEVLFCLADVCASLQLTNANNIVNQIKEEFSIPMLNIGMVTRSDGSRIEVNFITEPQLYFVMMRSRAKVAREFRQWICNEVIPEIRKRGAYIAKTETKTPATKKCWYVEQLTALFESYGVNREVLAHALDITSRAFKQGYAIGISKASKEPHPDFRFTGNETDKVYVLTEEQYIAVQHIIHYHELFKPSLLKIAEVLRQVKNLPIGQLSDAATEPSISVNRLKSIKQGLMLTALLQ